MFFQVNRNPPKGDPVTECQLRHLAVSLSLLIILAGDMMTGGFLQTCSFESFSATKRLATYIDKMDYRVRAR